MYRYKIIHLCKLGMLYIKKTIRHFRGLLSFRYYMVCNNARRRYKKPEYLADKKRAEKFMYSFNYKKNLTELLRSY